MEQGPLCSRIRNTKSFQDTRRFVPVHVVNDFGNMHKLLFDRKHFALTVGEQKAVLFLKFLERASVITDKICGAITHIMEKLLDFAQLYSHLTKSICPRLKVLRSPPKTFRNGGEFCTTLDNPRHS